MLVEIRVCVLIFMFNYIKRRNTRTIEKSKYGDFGAFQNHYIAQIYTQLKDVFHWQKRRKNAKEEKNN